MSISTFLSKLNTSPESIQFTETMAVIKDNYAYTASTFVNGDITNEAGSNEGSCKIFAFAQLNQLTKAQTLACFGDYYRQDVLPNPEGSDHANIRNFITHGWAGIKFSRIALTVN
ncbi:HopJ type III effector protein [Thalassotalea sp. ND16A]|uniref:HopJ type III effector protein n=1 Tax=Thalassotalea sp. ND16A TaxID=1535422 RepID=UPI00051A326F|nr:HopJ type III effector protein [Thalassotalea sp. ND16A]KGJ89464.1 hypothetical protein ND16A_2357 [Thalassotalea sp. ND16A]